MSHRNDWILLERKDGREKQKRKGSREGRIEGKKWRRKRREEDWKLAIWNVFCLALKGIICRFHKHQTEFLFPVGTKIILMSILNWKSLSIPETVGYLNVCNLSKM